MTRGGWREYGFATRRSLSTSPVCRDGNLMEPEENLSSFKKQRRTLLSEEQQSEDPLYPESHPRLQDAPKRWSVPEFIEAFRAIDHSEFEQVTVYGRVRSKRVAGKSLIFLDIVNEFERLQVMVNKSKVIEDRSSRGHKFALFRNLIEVGDHICRNPNMSTRPVPKRLTTWQQSRATRLVPKPASSRSRRSSCPSCCLRPWSRSQRSSPTPRRACRTATSTCW